MTWSRFLPPARAGGKNLIFLLAFLIFYLYNLLVLNAVHVFLCLHADAHYYTCLLPPNYSLLFHTVNHFIIIP